MDEEFEDDTERERQWLKKEFGENDELFKALQGKLKKKDNFLDEWEKIKREKMEENKNKKIKKKICPDCKGRGVIYTEYPWSMFAFNPIEKHICPKCNGEGSDYVLFFKKKIKNLEKLKEELYQSSKY